VAIQYTIEFAAALARLEQGSRAASGHVKKMADEIESASSFARKALLAIAGALGVSSFASAIKGASDAADAAAKMGDRFGIATEKMIGMQHAGELAGMSQEGLANSLRSMAKFASDAARGGVEQSEAMAQLGLRAQEFIRLPMDQQLSTIIDKLGQVENVTLRNALAQEVLGKGAGEMMNLVAEGSEAFAQAARDAEAWGLAVNRIDAAKLELANDAITRAQAAAKGLFTTIAVNVAPVIKLIAERFADTAAEARGFRNEVAGGMDFAAKAIGSTIWFVERLQFAYSAVKLGVAAMAEVTLASFAFILQKLEQLTNIASYLPGPLGLAARGMNALARAGSEGVAEMAAVAGNRLQALREELDKLALGSKTLEQWQGTAAAALKAAADNVENEARRIAASRQAMQGGPGGDIERDEASEGKAPRDIWREQLAQKLERIREENMSELELLAEKHREKNVILQSAVEAEIITEEQGLAMAADLRARRERLELEHQAKLGNAQAQGILQRMALEKMTAMQQAQFYFGYLANITAAAAQNSRAMFQLNKMAGIANALISANEGAAAALKWGWPFGPIFAGIIWAAGLANVLAIKRTEFGSTTSAPSIGAGAATPVTPATNFAETVSAAPAFERAAPQKPKPEVNVTLIGEFFSYSLVAEKLIPLINEAGDNGLTINVRTA